MRVSEKRESDVGEEDEMKNSGDIQMWGPGPVQAGQKQADAGDLG